MMTREQYILRISEIESQKNESKLRQHEQCQAADAERIRVQNALTDAKDKYVRKYRDEMAAALNLCADTCKEIRRREKDLQLRLARERWELEGQWAEQNKGEAYTLPDGQEGGAL